MSALADQVLALADDAVQRANVVVKELIFLLVKYHILLLATAALCLLSLKYIEGFTAIKILLGIGALGLLAYAVLFKVVNAYQLYLNFMYAVVPVLFFWALLWAAKNQLGGAPLLVTVVLFFMFLNVMELATQTPPPSSTAGHSPAYLHRIEQYLDGQENRGLIGASFNNQFESAYYSYVTIYTLGAYLSELHNGACTISMSDGDIPPQANPVVQQQSENGRKLGWLHHHMEQQRANGSFVSYRSSQRDLFLQAKFPYAICAPSYQLPRELQQYVQQQFSDPVSGERFLVFHYPNPALAGQ